MKYPILFLGVAAMMVACQTKTTMKISDTTIQQAVSNVLAAHSEADSSMVERGAKQVAALWRESDGAEEDYLALITNSYAGTAEAKNSSMTAWLSFWSNVDKVLIC